MRHWSKLFLGMALSAASLGAVQAEAYPARPISLYVPYSPGGVTDVITRGLAKYAGEELGQTILIENKTGANGTMGAIQLLRAKPDGYSLSIAPIGLFRMPYIQGTNYDPAKDFTYISMFAGYNYVIAVNAQSQWHSIKDLVDYAKTHDNAISYGSPGAYSSQHLAMVELGQKANVNWTHIPFKGDADTLNNLLGNNIHVAVGATTLLPYVKAGKLRVLATLGSERNADFPDAPTLKEVGYPIVFTSPIGIIGPKGMDNSVVQKLDAAFKKALQNPEMGKLLQAQGIGNEYLNHADYTKYAEQTNLDEAKTILGLKKTLSQQ